MTPTRQGSFRLFRFAGIDVFLHWSWFLIAIYAISIRAPLYTSMIWPVLEYVSLFVIVLLHEFGHSLACRQVGGRADQIVLWPLGGVAYVSPPPRPGATLWSIAAGPLVNVILFPLLTALWLFCASIGWRANYPNAYSMVHMVWLINLVLLIFNLLPIYPLDGGQILRSLLWFPLGRARSLMVATVVGFVGVGAMILAALWMRDVWFGILAVFILLNCWGGLMHARTLARLAAAPRHSGFSCPSCHAAPPQGALWTCGRCHRPFDMFATQGVCPQCGAQFGGTNCPECGQSSALTEWLAPPRA